MSDPYILYKMENTTHHDPYSDFPILGRGRESVISTMAVSACISARNTPFPLPSSPFPLIITASVESGAFLISAAFVLNYFLKRQGWPFWEKGLIMVLPWLSVTFRHD